MYIRKQEIYTEKKIFPYVGMEDLRLDLLPGVRTMAANNSPGNPWNNMSDEELLKSARLYATDRVTGASGFNLAAVMLLGKDDVIADVIPAYVTDALLRRVDVDRYDDREIIKTNLIESYERLMDFGRKHLPDKFYLEQDQRKSLRNIIVREIIANTLIHREYTSSYQARFVIESARMYTENANRASKVEALTPDNIEPNPKNPIIAAFFRNIGYADQLGSGVRNLYKYSRHYSGMEPEFDEGDVFRIIVPLDDSYVHESELVNGQQDADKVPINADKMPTNENKINNTALSAQQRKVFQYVKDNGQITSHEAELLLQVKQRRARFILGELADLGVLERQGAYKSTVYVFRNENKL